MLGDERERTRRDLRHPWRRARPHLPAPRERDRAERKRPCGSPLRAGHPFARVWMHNEMLTVDGVKMSKSLGNITTVRDILANAPGEAIRLALLSTHYRDPLDWTAQKLAQARTALDRFYRALDLPEHG